MVKKSTINPAYLIISALLLIVVVVAVTALAWPRHMQRTDDSSETASAGATAQNITHDTNVVQDLYTLEKAIIIYYEASIAPEDKGTKTLPATLNVLTYEYLNNSLTDYTYSYENQTSGGGPTVSFTLCAVFETRSSALNDASLAPPHSSSGPEAYEYHDKGRQCFENSYYKSSSHITTVK